MSRYGKTRYKARGRANMSPYSIPKTAVAEPEEAEVEEYKPNQDFVVYEAPEGEVNVNVAVDPKAEDMQLVAGFLANVSESDVEDISDALSQGLLNDVMHFAAGIIREGEDEGQTVIELRTLFTKVMDGINEVLDLQSDEESDTFDEVADKLGLSEEQKQTVKDITEDALNAPGVARQIMPAVEVGVDEGAPEGDKTVEVTVEVNEPEKTKKKAKSKKKTTRKKSKSKKGEKKDKDLELPEGVMDVTENQNAPQEAVADSMGLGNVSFTEEDTAMENTSSFVEETIDPDEATSFGGGVEIEEA